MCGWVGGVGGGGGSSVVSRLVWLGQLTAAAMECHVTPTTRLLDKNVLLVSDTVSQHPG